MGWSGLDWPGVAWNGLNWPGVALSGLEWPGVGWSGLERNSIKPDKKTLEFRTVSLSFEELLPRLTFTCSCFICGTVPLVFICDCHKCRRLSEPYFLSSG